MRNTHLAEVVKVRAGANRHLVVLAEPQRLGYRHGVLCHPHAMSGGEAVVELDRLPPLPHNGQVRILPGRRRFRAELGDVDATVQPLKQTTDIAEWDERFPNWPHVVEPHSGGELVVVDAVSVAH